MAYNDLADILKRRSTSPLAPGRGGVIGVTSGKTGRKIESEDAFDFDGSNVDEAWAERYTQSKAPMSYFDYFYAGEDIKVTIDGVEDDYGDIPVMNLAFTMEQQKTPVYGLWSYTFDGVLRGTRLLNGTFTIATKSTHYMRKLLEKAASSRAAVNGAQKSTMSGRDSRPLTDDDASINKFWGDNLDPYLGEAGKQMFSIHPPFNFVVTYGVQDLSLSPANWNPRASQFVDIYADNAQSMDVNGRFSDSDPINQTSQLRIEAVELQNMSTGFTPDGSVVAETYTFFARDLVIPPNR